MQIPKNSRQGDRCPGHISKKNLRRKLVQAPRMSTLTAAPVLTWQLDRRESGYVLNVIKLFPRQQTLLLKPYRDFKPGGHYCVSWRATVSRNGFEKEMIVKL